MCSLFQAVAARYRHLSTLEEELYAAGQQVVRVHSDVQAQRR